jgi:5,6-dimethylbenzimidazole synthase
VRHFRCDPLDEATVEWLFEMADRAPSVGLSQPWRFVRVVSPALREALARHADAEAKRAGTRYAGERRALYEGLKLHGLREAPLVLAAWCDEATESGQGLGAVTMPETRRYSCVMAIHSLWLAAQTRGIGLGWVSIVDPAVIADLLDVPPAWHCLGLLCLGLPEATSDEPELQRAGWERRADWRSKLSER